MNLTLEALKKGKQKCVDIAGLESVMSVNERTEIQMALTDLSKSFDQCINVVAKIEEVKGSLEKFGYTDEWYDTVFMMSGIENFVEFDIPKLTTYGTKQEACMEGFVDTVWEWIKKAWNFLKMALNKLYQFIMWAAKKLGLNTKHKSDVLNAAVNWIKNKEAVKTQALLDAIKEMQIDLESFFDDTVIERHLNNLSTLLDIVNDTSTKDEIITYAEELKDKNGEVMFMTADRIRVMYGDLLKAKLDNAQLNYSDPLETGFTIKVNPANNKMVFFFGKQIGKQFPQVKISIDELDSFYDIADRINKLVSGIFDNVNNKFTNCQKTLQTTADADKIEVDKAAANRTHITNPQFSYSACHARLMATNLMLDIVAGGVSYLTEAASALNKDMDMCLAVTKMLTEAANQKPASQP